MPTFVIYMVRGSSRGSAYDSMLSSSSAGVVMVATFALIVAAFASRVAAAFAAFAFLSFRNADPLQSLSLCLRRTPLHLPPVSSLYHHHFTPSNMKGTLMLCGFLLISISGKI